MQGSQTATYEDILNRELLDTETDNESYNSRYSDDTIAVSSNKTEVIPQSEAVTHSHLHTDINFRKGVREYLVRNQSIHNKFTKVIELIKQGNMNNIGLINTQRKENHDVSQEISMLKMRLHEEMN